MKTQKEIISVIIGVLIIGGGVYYFSKSKTPENKPFNQQTIDLNSSSTISSPQSDSNQQSTTTIQNNSATKNNYVDPFNFNNWIKKTVACQYGGLEYRHPLGWRGDEFRYLSPLPIQYFGKFGLEPNNAAIKVFDLVEDNDPTLTPTNYMVKRYSDYMAQIQKAGRRVNDEDVSIDERMFKKYDLTNFAQYQGKDYGNVLIFISPQYTHQDRKVRIAFEWDQFPAGQKIDGNTRDMFLRVISSIEFNSKSCNL